MKLLENPILDAINEALHYEAGGYRCDCRVESYSCKMTQSEKRQYKAMASQQRRGNSHRADGLRLAPPASLADNFSPPKYSSSNSMNTTSDSEDGGTGERISAKTLFHLVSTLNAAYPDYEFSDCGAGDFYREPDIQWVLDQVDDQLTALQGAQYGRVKQQIWSKIDEEIRLNQCDVFSYSPVATEGGAGAPFFLDLNEPVEQTTSGWNRPANRRSSTGDDGSLVDDDDADDDDVRQRGVCVWSFNYLFYNRTLRRIVLFTCTCYRAGSTGNEDDGSNDNDKAIASDNENYSGDESVALPTPDVWAPSVGPSRIFAGR